MAKRRAVDAPRSRREQEAKDPLRMKPRKAPPHAFVLEAIAHLKPRTRSMFGCIAVYIEEKIVFFLRDKTSATDDNGVWIATSEEHHKSLRCEFPNMRSIRVVGGGMTGWQVLPSDAADFEEAALHACELVAQRDPRIGKIPERQKRRRT